MHIIRMSHHFHKFSFFFLVYPLSLCTTHKYVMPTQSELPAVSLLYLSLPTLPRQTCRPAFLYPKEKQEQKMFLSPMRKKSNYSTQRKLNAVISAGLCSSYGGAPGSQPYGGGFESRQFHLKSKTRQGPPIGGGAKIPENFIKTKLDRFPTAKIKKNSSNAFPRTRLPS